MAGDETRGRRTEGEAQVDRHPVCGIGRDAVGGRHEVGQEGAARGTVEFPGKPGQRRERDDHGERVRLGEEHHRGPFGEHRGGRSSCGGPGLSRLVAAEHRRDDVARAVGADRDPGLRDRVAAACQIKREKRDDEAPELVQEGPEEKDPGHGRQRPQVRQQGGGFVHGKQKTLLASRQAGSKILVWLD